MSKDADIKQRLSDKILGEIPISRAMGFRIEEISEEGAECSLPLASNTNHLGTLFGGSLYSAGALSCYTALLGLLARIGFATNNIVITQGHIDYLAPGTGDARYVAKLPHAAAREAFERALKSKGRARMRVVTEVYLRGSEPIARIEGEYLVREN
jgi:thioesterase domain-containing protein